MRFGSTYLGSSAYAGCLDASLLSRVDADGVTLRKAIQDAGGDLTGVSTAAAHLHGLRHYFEVHIEQGPALLGRGLAVGVVTAIAGAVRRRITLAGTASHAGTTPMPMRHDAALADIDAGIEEIAARRGVTWQCEPLLQGPAVPCSAEYRGYWRDAIQESGLPVIELPSGAGHDAVMMSRIAPISMLFVRCGNGGISHNPLETVSQDGVQTALAVTPPFLDRIGPCVAQGLAEPGA